MRVPSLLVTIQASRYGLDGPGIESRWGEIFRTPPDSPSVQGLPGLLPGCREAWRVVNQAPISSAEAKERVELYLYSAPGPSWAVLGQTLQFFTFTFNSTSL